MPEPFLPDSHIICSDPLSARTPNRNPLLVLIQLYQERLQAVEKLQELLDLHTVTEQTSTHRPNSWWELKIKSNSKRKTWRGLTKPAIWNYYHTFETCSRSKQCSLPPTVKNHLRQHKNTAAALTGAWTSTCPGPKSSTSHKSDVQEVSQHICGLVSTAALHYSKA